MAGKYERVELIGSGTFGRAWLVHRMTTGREYVMKEIKVSGLTERDRGHAVTEVQAMSRCRHVNVIRYREAFLSTSVESGPVLCIVMEHADAGDLRKKIENQNGILFDEQTILEWFVQICFAMKYIHSLHILHRDLKTANVFLTADNVLKIGDFGISRILTNTLDQASTVIGTPYYLSPEICQRQSYGTASDMWACGCVLYELCAHDRPFKGSTLSELILNIIHGTYAPISKQYGKLAEDLIAVLLQSDPGARPTAAQVLAIPAVRPYAESYVRRIRLTAERCSSPTASLSLHLTDLPADNQTGNEFTPEPEAVVNGDVATIASNAEDDKKTSNVTSEERNCQPSGRAFIVQPHTPLRSGVNIDAVVKQLATPGESNNENGNINAEKRCLSGRYSRGLRPVRHKSCGTPIILHRDETRRSSVRSDRRPLPRKKTLKTGGRECESGASPRRSVYREALGRDVAAAAGDKTEFVSRLLRRVKLNTPTASSSPASTRRQTRESSGNDEKLQRVCRALLSTVYRGTDAGRRPAVCQQLSHTLTSTLLRQFGVAEFTRLLDAVRGVLMTSLSDAARRRRLDAILASNHSAVVHFPLFFQLVQLENVSNHL